MYGSVIELKGYVENIIYRREDNGYTVFVLAAGADEITCVGTVPFIEIGENARVRGEMTEHMIYGEQLKLGSYERLAGDDPESMHRYLASGAIKGIGARMADRIIEAFGDDTAHVLEFEPERLAEIKGIGEKKAREIAIQYKEKSHTREAFIFLRDYGLSDHMAVLVYDTYGDEIYRIMRENPYRLAEDIRGIGFKTADEIARRAGVEASSEYRLSSGIIYELMNSALEGNMYTPMEELIGRCIELLEVDGENIREAAVNLAAERKLLIKIENDDPEPHVYPLEYYYTELKCATMLKNLQDAFTAVGTVPEDDPMIQDLERELDMQFDEMQRAAIAAAASNGILIVTGGPGTGKTTMIKAMISYFTARGREISLAAPTGRAAKRMSEACGYEASTIHRLLELMGGPGEDGSKARFDRNEDNPLEADVVILDEMSMVDIFIFKALLSAIAPGTRLIMVGDVDQLPSVGPGQVLRDLVESDAFPVVRLNKIFRQSYGSDIVVGAHEIKEGRCPRLDNKSRDFFFLPRDNAGIIYKHMVQLITGEMNNLPSYVDATSFDIQVLAPMRKGNLGVNYLNEILQQHINPPSEDKPELEFGSIRFRLGDKVIQTKNNYQAQWTIYGKYNIPVQTGTGIFNGDLGRIRNIDVRERVVEVEFDENKSVLYEYSQLEELELAYALTIHKSQGSEYPAVIIPLLTGTPKLMNRNLIYTAITRARKCVVILGSEKMLRAMIDNTRVNLRRTGLKLRIREVMTEV